MRAFAQKDPLIEYQRESFSLFEAMLARVRAETVEYIFRIQAPRPQPESPVLRLPSPSSRGPAGKGLGAPARPERPAAVKTPGRNDPCPCGSGKKYKKCHGQ